MSSQCFPLIFISFECNCNHPILNHAGLGIPIPYIQHGVGAACRESKGNFIPVSTELLGFQSQQAAVSVGPLRVAPAKSQSQLWATHVRPTRLGMGLRMRPKYQSVPPPNWARPFTGHPPLPSPTLIRYICDTSLEKVANYRVWKEIFQSQNCRIICSNEI